MRNIYPDGHEEWHNELDQKHRIDGPAYISGGIQHWYLHDKLHRDDGGPAVINSDGSTEWWINGERHRTDGPALINSKGSHWYFNGERHRVGGPALISRAASYSQCSEMWFMNGNFHREDGPAIIWLDGSKEWWLNNRPITEEVETWLEEVQITFPFSDEEKILFKLRFA
jgi:hypothetical protein